MIKGKFKFEVELPTGDKYPPTITAEGEYTVNSREELMDYVDQALSAIEAEGRRRLTEHEGNTDDGTD